MSDRALLLDLDGTCILSDDVHEDVFVAFLREHGLDFERADYTAKVQGRLNQDIFSELLPGKDADALSDEKERRFRERLDETRKMPGLDALLDRADDAGWRVAVVTNAPRDNADAMLAHLDMTRRIQTLVIAGELPRGKPDPMAYLTALERLGVAADAALAFEDSRSGVRAAAAAGVATLGLRSSLDHAALVDAGALDSLADFEDKALSPHLARLETA